jgi:hypothetical protein
MTWRRCPCGFNEDENSLISVAMSSKLLIYVASYILNKNETSI